MAQPLARLAARVLVQAGRTSSGLFALMIVIARRSGASPEREALRACSAQLAFIRGLQKRTK
jgi:hypothetical protein